MRLKFFSADWNKELIAKTTNFFQRLLRNVSAEIVFAEFGDAEFVVAEFGTAEFVVAMQQIELNLFDTC